EKHVASSVMAPLLAIAPEVLTRRSLRRGARYGHKGEHVASGVMARSWPLRPRSLHADYCAGERVMGVKLGSQP
ncbi:hypothetical protein LaR116_12105, partial [Lacticaseibacillus rhamnosus]